MSLFFVLKAAVKPVVNRAPISVVKGAVQATVGHPTPDSRIVAPPPHASLIGQGTSSLTELLAETATSTTSSQSTENDADPLMEEPSGKKKGKKKKRTQTTHRRRIFAKRNLFSAALTPTVGVLRVNLLGAGFRPRVDTVFQRCEGQLPLSLTLNAGHFTHTVQSEVDSV